MREIELTKGKVALVDDEDYELVSSFNWYASFGSRNSKWYARRRLKVDEREQFGGRRWIFMHQFIMWPPPAEGMVVDHVVEDGVEAGLDNRRSNLKWTTQTENMTKSPGWKKKGVSCSKKPLDGIDF